MTRTVSRRLAGASVVIVLAVYALTSIQFSIDDPAGPTEPYRAVWMPIVSTDCDIWTIRQSEAAIEDVWPHVDYMTVNGEGRWEVDDRVTVSPASTLVFEFWGEGQVVYRAELGVDAGECPE